MMDETTDVSETRQAAIITRHHETKIKEDLLGFVKATDRTGAEFVQLLITTVESLGLSMDRCRGLAVKIVMNALRSS